MIAVSVARNVGLSARQLQLIPFENCADCRFGRFPLQAATTNAAINFSDFKKPLLVYCPYGRNADYRLFKVKCAIDKTTKNPSRLDQCVFRFQNRPTFRSQSRYRIQIQIQPDFERLGSDRNRNFIDRFPAMNSKS